jgi:phage terminase small subunit
MLTPKQKAFSDYYIECGNASEAARRAGYSPKTAEKIGSENLQKPEISAYIQERMAQQDASRVASADEVLRFYSSVMRGQEKDAFGLDPSLADRLKAADSLMKRYAIGAEKQKGTLEKLDSLLKEMHDAAYMDT